MRVIILLHELQHYRVPVFNELAKKVDLTVSCNKNLPEGLIEKINFRIQKEKIIKRGPFLLHKRGIHNIIKPYDVVLSLMNLRCIDVLLYVNLPKRNKKVILWGIGVSGSHTKQFGTYKKLDWIKKLAFKKSDGLIFYTDYAKKYFSDLGFNLNKLFTANNTVSVIECNKANVPNDLLFLGSLYPEKGLDNLILEFNKLHCNLDPKSIGKLHIVGDGPLKNKLHNLVERNIKERVIFHGAINDDKKLAKIFENCLVCISPTQAGLTVLKSMGFGTCFITTKSAITGGEILNIVNNETGIILDDKSQLLQCLMEVYSNPLKFLFIGQKAKIYYHKNRKVEFMANDLFFAINTVYQNE